MKNIALTLLMILAPSLAFGGQVAERAKKLEAEMNATKADFSNPAIAEISRKAAVFVNQALAGGAKLDAADYHAVARIIVRAYDYDQEGDMADCNAGVVAKHRKSLSKAVTKLVGEAGISEEALNMGRIFIEGGEEPEAGHVCGILRALKAENNGGGKAGPASKTAKSPAKKTGGIIALFKKPQVTEEEGGAGLSKNVSGGTAWSDHRQEPSLKALKHLEPAQEKTFSSFDPTVAGK